MLETTLAYAGLALLAVFGIAAAGILALRLLTWAAVRLLGTGDD